MNILGKILTIIIRFGFLGKTFSTFLKDYLLKTKQDLIEESFY